MTMMMTMQMSRLCLYVRGLGVISRGSEALKRRRCTLIGWVIATAVKVTGDQLDQILPPWITHYNSVQRHAVLQHNHFIPRCWFQFS